MNLFLFLGLGQNQKLIYLRYVNLSFCFSISSFKCWLNLVRRRTSFFSFIISPIITTANTRTRMDMKGKEFMYHWVFSFSFFSSCLNCHPSRMGKKNRIIHPTSRSATAHSKCCISHSRVNHSIIFC